MMKCVFCGGTLKKEYVTFSYDEDDTYILVEHVPAEVCTRCGEKLYSPQVTDVLLQFAQQQFQPVKVIQVPVYEFAEAAFVETGLRPVSTGQPITKTEKEIALLQEYRTALISEVVTGKIDVRDEAAL